MHVVIIGGGVMGCASAEAILAKGHRVTLLEKAVPGAEASSAAAGILGAQVESHDSPDLRATFVRARSLYPAWAESLRSSTGIDVGYRRTGVVRVAFDDAEASRLAAEVAAHGRERLSAELLGRDDLLRLEPELSPRAVAGAYFPDDGQVDPRALLRALVAHVARAGVTIRSGSHVRSLLLEGGACRGVVTDDDAIEADAVVLAAGSWSSLVGGLPPSLPSVSPVRGQIVLLDERPPSVRTIVFGPSGYVVPRGDGRVLCGSTMEHVGFRSEVTAGGMSVILSRSIDLVPRLGAASFGGAWASFRPMSSGATPMVGASPMAGLFLATGHHRNGILLAKFSANAVADAIDSGGRMAKGDPTA
jgi:glycine oxidase